MGVACDYATSNLRLEIAYKSASYSNTEVLPQGKGDCDKKAIPMYDILGWQESEVLGPDTMNSFQTTFTQILAASDSETQFKRDNRYTWLKILKNNSLPKVKSELVDWTRKNNILYNLSNFIEIHYENYKSKEKTKLFLVELEKFAGLTSSIGNFIVLPKKLVV